MPGMMACLKGSSVQGARVQFYHIPRWVMWAVWAAQIISIRNLDLVVWCS